MLILVVSFGSQAQHEMKLSKVLVVLNLTDLKRIEMSQVECVGVSAIRLFCCCGSSLKIVTWRNARDMVPTIQKEVPKRFALRIRLIETLDGWQDRDNQKHCSWNFAGWHLTHVTSSIALTSFKWYMPAVSMLLPVSLAELGNEEPQRLPQFVKRPAYSGAHWSKGGPGL